MKKPFNPKRAVPARGIPRKRGLSQKGLKRLQELQGRDLGSDKSLQRLWELRYKSKFNKLVASLPSEFRGIGRDLLDEHAVGGAFRKLFSAERILGLDRVNGLVGLVVLKYPNAWVRELAVLSLGEFGSVSSVSLLEKIAVNGSNAWIRERAVLSLGKLGSVSSVSFLEKMAVNDSDEMVRLRAIWALGELRSVRSVSLIEKFLNDPDEGTRSIAAAALKKISASRAQGF